MNLEVGEVITVANKKYSVLDTILYEGTDYAFTNVVVNEGPSEQFAVFEFYKDDSYGSVIEVKDEKILERLLPIFSKNIEKTIGILNLQEKFNIN